MGFLLTRLPKMNLDTIWICQKNRFGTIYLKSVLINFFYCCKYSVERGILERLRHSQARMGCETYDCWKDEYMGSGTVCKPLSLNTVWWKRIALSFYSCFARPQKVFMKLQLLTEHTHAPDMINALNLKDMVAFTLSQPSHRIVSRFCSMQQHVQRIKKQEPLEASGRASNFRLVR